MGQSPLEKYKCIRCLKDDRISDGQLVQIDQCLNCTRYEPVYGQMYELLNDLGANVATILDDNQAGYSNMQEYIERNRVSYNCMPKSNAVFNLAGINNMESQDAEFNWGDGIKMKWDLYPKEQQKCHINWRQSVNDDGSSQKRLSSFQNGEKAKGTNMVAKPNNTESKQIVNSAQDVKAVTVNGTDDADKQKAEEVTKNAANVTDSKDDANNTIVKGMTDIKRVCQNLSDKGIEMDPLMLGSLSYVTNDTDYEQMANDLVALSEEIGTKNPTVILAAYSTSKEVILGQDSTNVERSNKSIEADTSYSGTLPDITKPLPTTSETSEGETN